MKSILVRSLLSSVFPEILTCQFSLCSGLFRSHFSRIPEDTFFQTMTICQNQTQSVELHVIRLSRVPALNNNEIFR